MSLARKKRYPAQYVDGQVAKIWPVSLEFKRKQLTIYDDDGQCLGHWGKKSIERVHPKAPDLPIRLKSTSSRSSARLILSEAQSISALMRWHPSPFHEGFSFQALVRVAAALGFITTITILVLYLSIPKMAKPIANMISPELEARMGASNAKAFTQDWPVCEGKGTKAIAQMVERLSQGRGDGYDLKVVVVDALDMNAFALPGGYIFVTDSLIKFMQSPEELAGVLAHEIGHVALKHPLEGTLSQMGVVFFLSVLTAGRTGDVMGLGATFAIVSYTRDYEQQADDYGLELLQKTNINPQGYADLFSRFDVLEKASGGDEVFGLTALLRTHPYSDKRAQIAGSIEVAGAKPVLTKKQWSDVKALCKSSKGDQNNLNGRVDKGKE